MSANLQGRVALVTGATSGIGKATAMGLARMGAHVVLVARDRAKGEATRAEIVAQTGNGAVDLLLADLSSQASVRQLAADIKAKYDRLHVLVNDAGAVFGERSLTVDQVERTFALNHLAYFLLTNLLLDLLKASAPSRIVNVTSWFPDRARLDFDNLQGERRYSGIGAYSNSKLGNMLFTYELARRLQGSGVTVNCVHPGVVRTNLDAPTPLTRMLLVCFRPFMAKPETAADRLIYLASSPQVEGVSGKYFADKREIRSPQQTYDETVARRLWEISAQLTGLVG